MVRKFEQCQQSDIWTLLETRQSKTTVEKDFKRECSLFLSFWTQVMFGYSDTDLDEMSTRKPLDKVHTGFSHMDILVSAGRTSDSHSWEKSGICKLWVNTRLTQNSGQQMQLCSQREFSLIVPFLRTKSISGKMERRGLEPWLKL